MRCDEARESFVDLLYDEGSAANLEVKDHLQTCLECRQELEELKHTRLYLQEWKDEAPLRRVSTARPGLRTRHTNYWKYLRYGAIAAMILICLLAVSNTELTWTQNGFSFRTSLFRRAPAQTEYYTKNEVRDLMKRALDDSEMRTNEGTYLMLQKMMDTMEQDNWMYSRTSQRSAVRNGNRN